MGHRRAGARAKRPWGRCKVFVFSESRVNRETLARISPRPAGFRCRTLWLSERVAGPPFRCRSVVNLAARKRLRLFLYYRTRGSDDAQMAGSREPGTDLRSRQESIGLMRELPCVSVTPYPSCRLRARLLRGPVVRGPLATLVPICGPAEPPFALPYDAPPGASPWVARLGGNWLEKARLGKSPLFLRSRKQPDCLRSTSTERSEVLPRDPRSTAPCFAAHREQRLSKQAGGEP